MNTADSAIDRAGGPASGDTLAAGVMMLLGLTVAQRLIGFVRSVLFCRWLEPDQLGQWDLSFGFLVLAAPVALLGLPGSFGRYIEFHRQRGHLKTFLVRVVGCSALLAVVASAAVALASGPFSQLIFGGDDGRGLVVLLAVNLGLWIAHIVLTALFNALRMTRIVAALQFVNSLAFAAFGCALLLICGPTAASVVLAFGGASLLSSVTGIFWLRRAWHGLPATTSHVPHRDFWAKLLPFAVWVWVANALANLFGLADRYLIVHHSGLPEAAALRLIGEYHSSRVVPLLFLGIAEMLAALITPHLSHDWEAGKHEQVARRLNLVLKLFSLALTLASVAVQLVSPWLFGVALAGKFAGGLAVLPWTLASCVWGSLAVVATNYLWCAERARLPSMALAMGLVVNVVLNLSLLPYLGLLGAALATAGANLIVLLVMYAASLACGLRIDPGVWLISLLPAALALGPWVALASLAAVALLTLTGERLFDADEKLSLADSVARSLRERRTKTRSRSERAT
ncbi:MAG TPA: lipopolysaccharide biosynthesis protein [Pirellulales bacterium]|nr:lipopolysaccharide biosynthesis protein [Pirellulales bacterium]